MILLRFDKPIFESEVLEEWVDYNGHMNDAAYAIAFSKAVDELMVLLGITETFRKEKKFTIYTLETHIVYLWEALEKEKLSINGQLIDVDEKRLHVFFTMKNEVGKRIATSEQMLIGIDETTGRSAPFPKDIIREIEAFRAYKIGRASCRASGKTERGS